MTELISLLSPPQCTSIGVCVLRCLVVLGGGIGLLTGLFGVGGGFLTVPLMNVLIGVPYALAVGSDLSMIVGTSTAGVLRHRRSKTVHFATALWIGGGSIIGAVLGDVIQDLARLRVGDTGFTLTMHGLFVVLLIGAVILTVHRSKIVHKKARQADAHIPPALLTLIGLGVGLLTGIMGIGGGVLLVPILLAVVGLPERTAAGTSLAIVFLSATVGTIKKTVSSVAKVSMPITLSLLISGVIGVQIGSALGQRLPGAQFRRYYVWVLAVAIVVVISDAAVTITSII